MTFLEAAFPYEPPIGEREMSALTGVRDVYGIRLMKFNQEKNTVTIEYDASRLTRSDIEFMLRNAGIRLRTPVARQHDDLKHLQGGNWRFSEPFTGLW